MAHYAIGDVQGCYDDLLRLLEKINFDANCDQLWFAGDLVNRGPKSLETLRFVKSLGESAVTVLGNHDLHLLAVAHEKHKTRKKDSLHPVLIAPDCDDLLLWLRQRPLLHYQQDYCLVHAGIPPQWDITEAQQMAQFVERILQGPDYPKFLKKMYGNNPRRWSPDLKGNKKARYIVNALTRMRYCTTKGKLNFKYNTAPGTQPENLLPWFDMPERKSAATTIIFGHWSTLGFYVGNNCFGLDTGCLWGGQLTALRLDDGSMQKTSVEGSVDSEY